jgi:anti-anti-sigma regulatory factor
MIAAAVTKKMGRLSVTVAPDGGAHLVTLAGELDDQATLSDLVDELGATVIVDLGGVRFINSVGVREWIIFLHALADRGAAVTLRACSQPMVHQMNMVVEARGAAEVESFQAPYLCESCAAEASITLDVADNKAAFHAFKMPTQTCADCGGTMQFDDFASRYLLFLD